MSQARPSTKDALAVVTSARPAEGLDGLVNPDAAQLLARTPRREVLHPRQIFVNRNLRLDRIEAVGLDMDYTVAIYHRRHIEELSFEMTLQKLVAERGYPELVSKVRYDHDFVTRGLVVDRETGNLLKMNRFAHVGRAYHGRRPLTDEERGRYYREEKIRPSDGRFAWMDTLFALPEACLFAEIIQAMESAGNPVDYGRLYDDIRDCIDTVHRDGSLKAILQKDIGRYVEKDPELGPTFHKLRSAGKRLFLLTNSLWEYTDAVMRYLLDGVLPEYPSWRNYFDVVMVGAAKPKWFSEQLPFADVNLETGRPGNVEPHAFERGHVYQGGNLVAFERMFECHGDRILYVGDHIYGDILRSKKSSLWRTGLVIQELENEVAYTDLHQRRISRLTHLEVLRDRLSDDVNQHKLVLNAVERQLERRTAPVAPGGDALDETRRTAKSELDVLRKALREVTDEAEALEVELESGFNPFWGLLFKEGNENSRFGEQVEQYACLYTSRVSNFLHYSPTHYFRSPREMMPHEQGG
jgi:5'-nucleotidase